MRKISFRIVFVFLFMMSFLPLVQAAENIFVAGETDLQKAGIEVMTKQCEWQMEGSSLKVLTTEGKYQWPGVTFRGNWNLDVADTITAVVKNTSKEALNISLRADDINSIKQNRWLSTNQTIEPGQTAELTIELPVNVPSYVTDKVFGMRGLPGGIQADINTGRAKTNEVFKKEELKAFWIYTNLPQAGLSFSVKKIFSSSNPQTAKHLAWIKMSEKEFFPMIDQFGQFKHDDWPGKIHSDKELKLAVKTEADDLASHPGFTDRDQFGGWIGGPKQKATGHFRVEKIQDKWWLVDPEGNLFWSHGVDCVQYQAGVTAISDREYLYEDLPAKDSDLGQFYGESQYAAHGYYVNRKFKIYAFFTANLYRKYGPDYKNIFTDLVHKRIKSWGLNTIANWSDPSIYQCDKTPYTITVGTWSPKIEGSQGFWGKFPDPFHPDFKKSLESELNKHGKALNDPWCLGIFVNNEIAWGNDTSLSEGTVISPKTQPAKIALLDWLKNKYKSIAQLNNAWNTSFANWDAFMDNHELPKGDGIKGDMKDFYVVIANEYFRNIHQILRAKAPNKLDLGCRFAWKNDSAVRVSTQYLDVVSFNMYTTDIADFKLPMGSIDKPCIVGEFHFGALDRGMLHTGLVKRKDQTERANTYESYVKGALTNRYWVGTHWFQFNSQATTGRTDGENYQIGFVDICDSPYAETIDAVRKVGQSMYNIRYTK